MEPNAPGRKKIVVLVRHNGREQSFEIEDEEFVIGRGDDATVHVDTPEISRHHVKVTVRDSGVTVRDLGSSNGTFVGPRRLRKHEDVTLPEGELDFALGRSVRVSLSVPAAARSKTAVLTSFTEAAGGWSHGGTSLNGILDMERKRLYEGVDSLKTELSTLLAQKRDIEGQLEKSRTEVEEKVLELRVEKMDLETELQSARDRVDLEMEAMETHREKAAREHESELARLTNEHQVRVDALTGEHHALVDKLNAELKAKIEKNERLSAELETIRSGLDDQLAAIRRRIAEAEETHRSRSATLLEETAKLEADTARVREAFEVARGEHEALSREIVDARLGLEREKDLAREELQRLKEESESARREVEQNRDQADQVRSEIASLDASLDELKDIFEKHREAMKTAETDLARTAEEAKSLRKSIENEREMHELETRRHKAQLETTALELQSRKAAFESDIEACKLEQMKARRDLQDILDRAATEQRLFLSAENRVTEVKAQIGKLEGDLQSKRLEVDDTKLRESEAAASVTRLKKEEEGVHESIAKARRELMALRSELDQTRSGGRAELDAELAKLRETTEAELSRAREAAAAELAQAREADRQKFEAEKARRIEELEKEFARKGTAMELDLAQAKLSKLGELEKLGEEKAALDRYRRDFMVSEIVRGAQELARGGSLVSREGELRSFVLAVLEGKTTSTTSAQAVSRTYRFWAKLGASIAAPVAAVLVLYLFPEIPAFFKDHVSRKIASEKKENGIFYDQIKQKGAKYQPEQDRRYRASYADNLLCLEGYSEMKLSEEEKRKWILVLNDFIVGRLGLGDRVIPNFISAESIMVRDLMKVREGMLPQFKDQGLARMADIETRGSAKLTALLDGPANYQKFRALEKSYYEDYLTRKPARPAALDDYRR